MKKHFFYYCLLPVAYCLLLTSCKKDSFITDAYARLNITSDTLKYDTVFTTIGSITKSFKIINENNQKLRLGKVKLMGGSGSSFKMNVDGIATNETNDLDIAANDSIYVFVSVTINPNASNLPFIVSDSILISYNGNTRFVQLQSFGQNANFLRNKVITDNVVWTNNLPYVILGSIRVDTTATLTIQPGCRIYSHADAPFIVDGTLTVNGTKTNNVVFAGDRLDDVYKDLPASWPGIYFRGNQHQCRRRADRGDACRSTPGLLRAARGGFPASWHQGRGGNGVCGWVQERMAAFRRETAPANHRHRRCRAGDAISSPRVCAVRTAVRAGGLAGADT